MQQKQTRREWIGQWPRLLPLSFLSHQAPHASAQSPWQPPVTNAIAKTLRASLGRQRGGAAVVGLDADSAPVFSARPSSPKDAILDATQSLWRPGSLVKPFLLEALASKKLLHAASEYRCKGHLRIADRVLDCSHPTQPGAIIASEALALSCNEFFAHFAGRLPVGAFAATLREAGFAARQPFGLSCAPAMVEPVQDPHEHLLQCLGEAHVLSTPLALLAAFQTFVGRLERQPRSLATAMLRDGMRGCVESGTGQLAKVQGLAVAGKTGTGGARGHTHLNGWFLSYAPVDSPRFVMVTFVENGTGGGNAAPLAAALWTTLGDHGVLS